MSSTDLEKVEPHSWQTDTLTLDAEPARPSEENVFSIDYYEILRVGPQADEETIERVYRTLADRFHPDNLSTGDPETFLRVREAYETLSNPAERARYNILRQYTRGAARFWLRGREFFDGVRGGQNRRLAVLCLLYRQRIGTHESPGLSILDLERLTGCTREELTYALWYLCEKKWATMGESSAYSITADGFDIVESKLEDRLEFRALATLCYYGLPTGPEDAAAVAARFRKNGALPLEIEPARMIEGDVLNTDHYEVLGIGPQADEDDIERVYQTLAARFHPDNPGSGDEKAFQRIREAYETLSNRAKRTQYNADRQRSQNSVRFRLRGREFFDGIKGEQLRRLAVLCLLYRQAASDGPGLTALDLEQLTGCTREELGSALWYLREKKWAKSGAFTEYSITAAGFDVVENKLEEGDAARSRAWLTSEDSQSGEEVLYPHASTVQTISHGELTDIDAGMLPDENAEVAQELIAIEEALAITEQVDAETESVTERDIRTGESSDELPAGALEPARIEEPPLPVENVTRFAFRADPAGEPSQPAANIPSPSPRASRMIKAEKRVIFSMGGKGGVGKTNVMTGLAEWFEENQIPVTLLDLDTENKAKGSLTHFFGGRVPKINIHTPAGLDSFVDILAEDAPAILADMGAGAGKITHDWFDKMYPDVTDVGIVFTAIGVVTSDPASVESVLNWASALQDRVSYVIVENSLSEHADFTYWRQSVPAEEFRKCFQPAIIGLDWRLADLENAARNYGVTLGRVAGRTTTVAELQKASLVMRAQSYRRRMFTEFDKVKELLLP